MLVEDAGRCGCFVRDEHGPRRFGAATGRSGMHLGTGEPHAFAGGFGEGGAMRAEANQGFLKPWGQAPREQAQFLIQGCKIQLGRYRWRTLTQRHAHVATGAILANAERLVWAWRGSANHAASRITLRDAAINRCRSRVLAMPIDRERRKSLVRVA